MLLKTRLPMLRPLIFVYLHIPEHKCIIAESQGFATGGCHVPENDFPGYDIWKFLLVRIVGHLWIYI